MQLFLTAMIKHIFFVDIYGKYEAIMSVIKSAKLALGCTSEISRVEQENPLGKRLVEVFLLPRSVSLMYY